MTNDRILKESDVIEAVTQYISSDYPTEDMAREDAELLIGQVPSADIPHSDDWEKYSDRLWETAYERGRAQGLIPCSERLPEIGEYHISEPCIVYCKGGVYAFAELEENIFGQVSWNCERDDDYHEPIGEVVAWMPLPKPCEGVDDERADLQR